MEKSLSDVAYEQIKQKIIDGDYYPSQRLIEAQLAKTLNVGRHNVRVALDRLHSDGLVKIEPNRGASVASLSLDDALDTLLAREVLEVAAARLAAENITDEQIGVLSEYVQRMEDALEHSQYDVYSQTNKQFHQVIYEASRSNSIPWLIDLLKARLARLQLRTILIPGRSSKSLREHQDICLALKARDPEAAEMAVKAHMSNLRTTLQQAWSLVKL